MTLEQVYAAIGGDYKGVMERLPSADFVRRFALKFLQDDSFPNPVSYTHLTLPTTPEV